MTLFISLSLFLVVLLLQGTLLQLSCALCDVPRVPRYARALGIAALAGLLAALIGGSWSCTFGLLTRLIMGSFVADALQVAVAWLVTALVYRSALKLPLGHAAIVAGVHDAMAWALGAAVWTLVGWLG